MTNPTADEKLGELLLIVAEALRDEPAAGAVKVNKICFYAEFAHVRATGHPITGADYQRLANGPAPRHLRPVRRGLEAAGDARVVEDPYLGMMQHRLVALRAPRWELFSETEQIAIKQTLHEYASATGTELSEQSHEEPAWRLFEDGETIPFAMAFASPTPAGPKARARALELAAEHRARG